MDLPDFIPFLNWPAWLKGLIVIGLVYLPFVCLVPMFSIWWERKVSAHIQSRLGPMRTGGWHGWSQSIADGIKLFSKEDTIPDSADRPLFRLAPYLNMVPAFAAFAVLPFSARFAFIDLPVSIVLIFGLLAVEVLGVILAGWASNSKWAIYGAMREACQLVSYEIPLGLSLLVPAVAVGSLSLSVIGQAQGAGLHAWLIFRSPFLLVAANVLFVATLASCKRAPFDLPESESELVAGFMTEYSGMRWVFFMFAEYAVMFLLCGVNVLLFLGAWYDPFGLVAALESSGRLWLAGVIGAGIFILKGFTLIFLQMWIRWTLPRLRIDQVLHLCIKVLLPIACLDLVGQTLWVWLWPTGWPQMLVQVLLTAVGVGVSGYFFGLLLWSRFARRDQGIRATILTPWYAVPLADSPTSTAAVAGKPTDA